MGHGAGVGLRCLPCPRPPPPRPAPRASSSGCVRQSAQLGVCEFTHLTRMSGWYWGSVPPAPASEEGVEEGTCRASGAPVSGACFSYVLCSLYVPCPHVLCLPPRITSPVGTHLPTLEPASAKGFPPPSPARSSPLAWATPKVGGFGDHRGGRHFPSQKTDSSYRPGDPPALSRGSSSQRRGPMSVCSPATFPPAQRFKGRRIPLPWFPDPR